MVLNYKQNTNNVLYTKQELKTIFKDAKFFFVKQNFNIIKVAIDSREVNYGSLFFALKGENYDGHIFIKNAIMSGSTCIIAEYIPENIKMLIETNNINIIIVKNTMDALTELAKYNRNRIKSKVIAITGNIGKTSTRELISNIMSKFFITASSSKNYNNHIGLPYTLANTPINTDILVLEMGMNHLGEIEHLSKIAKPDISIITTIAPAHVESMIDVNTIVKAKAEIFKGMQQNGVVILNQENPYFNQLLEYAKKEGLKNILTVGTEKSHIFIKNYSFKNFFQTNYTIAIKSKNNQEFIDCNIIGLSYHNAFNTLFGFAVARLFNIDLNKVSQIISQVPIVEGRGNLEKIFTEGKHIQVINDAYNSSPEALKAAIRTLSVFSKQHPNSRAIAIIGDMLELGEKSIEYHNEILKEIIKEGIKYVITVGKETKVIHDGLPNDYQKWHFDETNLLVKEIRHIIQDGDILLFKASHKLNFEVAINKLRR